MTAGRIESDALGTRELPAEALHGIHTARAVENFHLLSGRTVSPALIHAYGLVKQACARTNHELGFLDDDQARALEQACGEMAAGGLDAHIVVDALQGGAGTSTNMNVNEVLANRALQTLGKAPGDYESLSPTEHVNLHQSTNDTYPTALKIAAIGMLRRTERDVVGLMEAFQALERGTAGVVKIGRTQMQDAVLTTLGREMGAYAEALGRDRWRICKCEERLRVVNLGGTAIGTGLGAPRRFIFRAVEHLRDLTGLGLARAENLVEATQNADVFVEVSGILKACASNLVKICADLRLLSSGPDAGLGEIRLPARQAGSSIMPGKVNPVIPEAVTQAALVVCGNDVAITQACSMGSLELNPFLPLVADALLASIGLLGRASRILREFCVSGIEPDEQRCRGHVDSSTAAATALIEAIGYDMAADAAVEARRTGADLRDVVVGRGLIDVEVYEQLIAPDRVNRLGSERGGGQ
ncbi:MAG: aspartate ammonia-lyase [Planctomycetes bacterium]|nr:aspartate ammonia-lyase [Planctomycetota bacterium]